MNKQQLIDEFSSTLTKIDSFPTGVRLYQELTDLMRQVINDKSFSVENKRFEKSYFKIYDLSDNIGFDLKFPQKIYSFTRILNEKKDVYMTKRPFLSNKIYFYGKYVDNGKELKPQVGKWLNNDE